MSKKNIMHVISGTHWDQVKKLVQDGFVPSQKEKFVEIKVRLCYNG